jgi:hypothetical protein
MDILQKQDLAAASFANDNTNAAGGLAVRTDAGSTVGAAITAATPDATTAVKGLVELATVAETPTLDTARAITPEGFTTTLAAKTAVATTGASRVGFLQQGAGAVGRTLQDRGKDWVSVKDFGAVGDGVADDTAAIQAAINAHKALYLPIGTYKITATLREATNGGALRIYGEHRKFSILSAPGLAAPVLWVGNSNGHGNYRCEFTNFTVDGVDRTAGSVGLILHEAGTSLVRDVDLKRCETLCKAVGVIGTTFDGKCEWAGATKGLVFSRADTGIPSGPNDLLVTDSPLSLNTNANEVANIWFTAIEGDVIVLDGGLTNVKGVVLQGCGASVNRDLVTFNGANENLQYRDGSSFEGWIEGGTYRYAIAIRGSYGTKIGSRTFIAGSTSNAATNFPKEGAIFQDINSRDTVMEQGISIWGFFVSPPTEGRLANAAVYTQGSLRREQVFTPANSTQSTPYYEGLTNPTVKRANNNFEIVITSLATTPVVSHDSHGIVASVVRNSIGDYTVTFNFNRIVQTSNHVDVQARTGSAVGTVNASCFGFGNPSNERIIVTNQAGALTDPPVLTLQFKTAWQGA